jgi:UDP-N-acetylmuramoyl-L-alanyl-D-glutamate--2,6-diaminopimelate ligase
MSEIAAGIPPGKQVHKIPDRREAIRLAMALAKPGDVVMITGKGHEKSICRGTTEYPWNDQEEVQSVFATLYPSHV